MSAVLVMSCVACKHKLNVFLEPGEEAPMCPKCFGPLATVKVNIGTARRSKWVAGKEGK